MFGGGAPAQQAANQAAKTAAWVATNPLLVQNYYIGYLFPEYPSLTGTLQTGGDAWTQGGLSDAKALLNSALAKTKTLNGQPVTNAAYLASLLRSGDYAGAWAFASQTNLFRFLETAFGPSLLGLKSFTPAQIDAYYAAAEPYWSAVTQTPYPYSYQYYGQSWGDGGGRLVSGGAVANIQSCQQHPTNPCFPDPAQFESQRPSGGFFDSGFFDVFMQVCQVAAIAVVTWGIGEALAPAAVAATAPADATVVAASGAVAADGTALVTATSTSSLLGTTWSVTAAGVTTTGTTLTTAGTLVTNLAAGEIAAVAQGKSAGDALLYGAAGSVIGLGVQASGLDTGLANIGVTNSAAVNSINSVVASTVGGCATGNCASGFINGLMGAPGGAVTSSLDPTIVTGSSSDSNSVSSANQNITPTTVAGGGFDPSTNVTPVDAATTAQGYRSPTAADLTGYPMYASNSMPTPGAVSDIADPSSPFANLNAQANAGDTVLRQGNADATIPRQAPVAADTVVSAPPVSGAGGIVVSEVDPWAGTSLEGLTVVKELGSGSNSKVWLTQGPDNFMGLNSDSGQFVVKYVDGAWAGNSYAASQIVAANNSMLAEFPQLLPMATNGTGQIIQPFSSGMTWWDLSPEASAAAAANVNQFLNDLRYAYGYQYRQLISNYTYPDGTVEPIGYRVMVDPNPANFIFNPDGSIKSCFDCFYFDPQNQLTTSTIPVSVEKFPTLNVNNNTADIIANRPTVIRGPAQTPAQPTVLVSDAVDAGATASRVPASIAAATDAAPGTTLVLNIGSKGLDLAVGAATTGGELLLLDAATTTGATIGGTLQKNFPNVTQPVDGVITDVANNIVDLQSQYYNCPTCRVAGAIVSTVAQNDLTTIEVVGSKISAGCAASSTCSAVVSWGKGLASNYQSWKANTLVPAVQSATQSTINVATGIYNFVTGKPVTVDVGGLRIGFNHGGGGK